VRSDFDDLYNATAATEHPTLERAARALGFDGSFAGIYL
jgi:hypothetical protein